MPFEPTTEQAAFFARLRENTVNITLDACAGSGKTTTIVEGLKVLPVLRPNSHTPPVVFFLAFNKSIAETLQARCPRHVQCSTFHSLGFRALKNVLPNGGRNAKVEGRKMAKLVYNLVERDDEDLQSIMRLCSLAKTVPELPTAESLRHLAGLHEMDLVSERNVFAVVQKAVTRSLEDLDTIDFDDMLWMPVMLNAPFTKGDFIFVDEAQDTNAIQLEILERMNHSRDAGEWDFLDTGAPASVTRYVFVGDPHQAIYGFRGANSNSITEITRRFSCETMPLSVSFRCPKAVVEEARKALL